MVCQISEFLLDGSNSCTNCMGFFVHKMIFCYFFVRFWFCCYNFPPLWIGEIVVLAHRNWATSVTWREELNKRSSRKKINFYTLFPGFYGSAKEQLYKTMTDFHCPFLSKRLSKFLVCCVVKQTGKLHFFSLLKHSKFLLICGRVN